MTSQARRRASTAMPSRRSRGADRRSVRAARDSADLVVVSLHWGVHMVPVTLAAYQQQAAHALIDAGADAILGHHPHLLKGVEIYRGRPVFYSLGNFAIEQPHVWDPAITRSASYRHLQSLNPTWTPDRHYMLPEVTRLSGAAQLLLDGSDRGGPFPAGLDRDDSAPRMLSPAEPEFERVREFLQRSSTAAGLNARLSAARRRAAGRRRLRPWYVGGDVGG